MARTLHRIHVAQIGSADVDGTTTTEAAIEAGIEVGTAVGTCVGTGTEVLAGKGLAPETAISIGTAVPRRSLSFRCGLTVAPETRLLQPYHNQHSPRNPARLPRHVSPRSIRD